MAIDYAALATEINTDPRGYGYANPVNAGSDNGVADLLNQVRATITVFKGRQDPSDFLDCFVAAEVTALTQANRDLLTIILGVRTIDTAATNVRTLIGAIFGGATTTRANLLAKFSRLGSRAEELFGVSTVITDQDVARALGR
jgi:hypothetical protein